MKRDMDMIRQLLLRLESQHTGISGAPVEQVLSLSSSKPPLCLEGDDPDAIHYHMRLLIDAGFVDMAKTQFGGSFNIRGLTWAGHDFLASVRDDGVWSKTKEGAAKIGGYSVDVLSELAKAYVKQRAKELLGLSL